MTEREKVIYGLEIQLEDMQKYADNDQPLTTTQEQAKEIIALLKEKEEVPVKQCEIMHMVFWRCGSCGAAITDGDKFCRICGRPVKWDNEIDKEVKTNGA